MAHSVVKVTDAMLNDSLLLLVGEDGTVTPDRETVENYLNSKPGATNIQLMHINKTDRKGIDISVDHFTFIPDVMNEVEVSGPPTEREPLDMEEVARNLHNFQLDHDYFTCEPVNETKLEDLVETLGESSTQQKSSMLPIILENTLIVPPSVEAISQLNALPDVPSNQTLPETAQVSTTSPVPPGKCKTIHVEKADDAAKETTPKIIEKPKIKEKPKIVQQIEEEFDDDFETDEELEHEDEEYGFEDDENDSDFEIEQPKLKTPKKTARKSKSLPKEKSPKKQVKVETKQPKPEMKLKDTKLTISKPTEVQEPYKASEKPSDHVDKEKTSTPSDKKVQKKEKKTPKPIPNDFMLFSTPDIIKRVGNKDPQTPTTSNISSTNSPAKISLENRSKSINDQSLVGSNKSNRASVDHKTPEKEKTKQEIKNKERRQSSGKVRKSSIDEKPKTAENKKETSSKNNKTLVSQNISLSGGVDLEMATPEDIRSIIMTEDVKSYTTSSLPLVQTSEISSTGSVDQSIALDDLDQSILDNINNDEISEDILYQVAQSLVGNTDLQKAIDKGLNEGNLVLDPSVQQNIQPETQSSQHLQETSGSQDTSESDIIKKGTQIVRPDGRILILPPIERPTTRSRNKKKTQEAEVPKISKPLKPLDNEHVSGNELDSSGAEDNQEEEESEDDPNKLWCICNQPHNNRFMICCDTCEEWYHGKCVNITKAMGQQMEEEGKEWICLFCKNPSLKRPQAAARRIRKASRASIDSVESLKKVEKEEVKKEVSKVSCIVCQKPARENSIYCSQSCILTHASGVEKVVVFEKSTGKMLSGNRAPTVANLEQWLKAHPTFEVYRSRGQIVTSKPRQKPQVFTQSKLQLVKNSEDQGVSLEVRKKGVKVGAIKHLPKHQESPADNKTSTPKHQESHTDNKTSSPKPTAIRSEPIQSQKFYAKTATTPGTKKTEVTPVKPTKPTTPNPSKTPKLVQTTLKATTPTNTPPSKEKPQSAKTPKPRQSDQQQTPVQTTPKQENIRENVQKTLFEQLMNRIKLDGTIKLTEEEVKEISNEIESQLHKCFGDTGQKYRNKYRSLIFNIKDVKNHTLWKRICEKSVNAYQLVRLSPDDLASQELALWREREAKHSLDMIKKSELELLNFSRQYVLKTHKGEQVVDDENRQEKVDNTEVIRTLTEDHVSDAKDSKSESSKDSQKKSLSKHGHKDRKSSKDRTTSKDHKKHRRSSSRDRNKDKDRSRSRRSNSKDRSLKKDRKRSRSRDRYRKSSHKSSRHKKESIHVSSTDKLDKKSKEILEQLVDNKIVPPLEDRLWKHVPQEDVIPRPAESDSDHEPSSTVTIPSPPHTTEVEEQSSQIESKTVDQSLNKEPEIERSMSPPISKKQTEEIWRGTISMIDVAHLVISAQEVSGDCSDLSDQLPSKLEIVGRISPETVWEYIGKMKCSNSKIISMVRLTAVDVVEKMPYLALYSYLSSRKRLGVVKSTNKAIKDFYILPLPPQTPIPQALLPINGPGFEESRPALLLGIIVRDKRKRGYPTEGNHSHSSAVKRARVGTPPLPSGAAIIPSEMPPNVEQPSRSYTPPSMVLTPPPPVSKDPRIKLTIPTPPVLNEMDDGDEPYSPEDSDPDNTIVPARSFPIIPESKPTLSLPIASSFDYTPVIPGLDVGGHLPASPLEIQKQMEELNKKIEAQKSEINSISKNIVSASSEIGHSALANIALPSNLQQILDSIKTISTEGNTEDNCTPLKAADTSLTIPLMLPKSFTRPPPPIVPQHIIQPPMLPDFSTNTIPLKLPTKLKLKVPSGDDSPGLLSSLTEEELVKKAAEMLGETEISKKHKLAPSSDQTQKKMRIDNDSSFDIEPPIPGVDN